MQLYTEYPKAWDAILEDCRSARSYIYIEHFILQDFNSGQIGLRLLDVLMERSRSGVKVKMILDAIGSYPLIGNTFKLREMKDAGIECEFFDIEPKWKATFPFNMFHRDHRKIVLVDDVVVHVGGGVFKELAHDWRDINVRLEKAEHEAYIQEIKGAFYRMWDEVRNEKTYENEYDKGTGVILKNDPEHNDLYNEILLRVKNATRRITIISPYISPSWKMQRALKAAARRGVDVRFIIPEEGDAIISTMVNASYLRELHRSKIKIHSFGVCMNHGKLVIIDDWVTVGSMNFDRLSFFYNRELNLVFKENIAPFEKLVEEVAACCECVGRDYFKKMTFRKRLYAIIGRLFRWVA